MKHAVIAALDQGTTSTRCILFNHQGDVVAIAQREHAQHFPQPGHVEHDAMEIWRNAQAVMADALSKASLTARDVAGLGITNQRETTVLWNRRTGRAGAPRAGVAGHARRIAGRCATPVTVVPTASAPSPACRWRATSAG